LDINLISGETVVSGCTVDLVPAARSTEKSKNITIGIRENNFKFYSQSGVLIMVWEEL
jgi:hypothetical protein